MTQIIVGEHETLDAALRRFGRKVDDAGIMREARTRGAFESKKETRRRAKARAIARSRRQLAESR